MSPKFSRKHVMAPEFEFADLVQEYNPILVLYPEIPDNSSRVLNPDYPHAAPLLYDYHPRDIRMILDHASLYTWSSFIYPKPRGWEVMLNRMERLGYSKDLDILPGVASDDRDQFWRSYASIPKEKEEYKRACYAQVVMGERILEGRAVIQYWYPYFYNDFWNCHEMDWETIMIVFKNIDQKPLPTVCAYSAHMGGHWLPWNCVEKANEKPERDPDGTHPISYVANGSHANYFFHSAMLATTTPDIQMAAKLLKTPRRLVDYTTSWESGDPQLVEARLIPTCLKNGRWTGNWRWLNQKGRWGSPGKWPIQFGDAGPLGPPQCGDPWNSPFRWIDTSCVRMPSRDECRIPTLHDPYEIEGGS